MKKYIAIALALLMLLGTAACSATQAPAAVSSSAASSSAASSSAASSSSGTSGSKGTIGIGLFYRRDEFYIDIETRLVADCKAAGYDVKVVDADADMAKMVTAIEDFTAQKVKGIICTGSEQLVSAIGAAVDAGIPVVCYDGSTNSDKVTANVTFDPTEDGVQVGNYVKQYISDNWASENVEVAVLDYPASAEICVGRTNGFLSVINGISNAKLVAQQDGKASRADSMAAAETILQAHPNVKVAYGINFDTIAGFYAALSAIGKKDTICVASGSWGEEAIKFLADNDPQYKAFTLMNPWSMADAAVNSLLDKLAGKTVEQKQAMSAPTYTAETIGQLDWKGIIAARNS